ncbi:Mce-associated membrane protein [Rhodococcus sp. 27YEA15]|uniref:hypothetical protein n=1 Tax=Rhodococcus sp. 27YEA15 TaxID=3156259 RepID=UPI003C7986BB
MNRTDSSPPAARPGVTASAGLKASLIAAGVVLVAALVALGMFGVSYARALTSDRNTAAIRDEALSGAQQVAINLNNADASNIDQSIENMRSSVTGDQMTAYLQDVQDSISDELRKSGSKTETEIVQSALTELNTDDKTATALVVVRVTATYGEQFRKNQIGMQLGMIEVDGVWKARSAEPIGTPIDLGSGTLPPTDGSAPAPTDGSAVPTSAAAPTTDGGAPSGN